MSLAWDTGSVALPFDQGFSDKVPLLGYEPSLFDIEPPNLGIEDWEWLLEWMSQQWLIGHNLKFDLMMMAAGTRKWAGRDLSDRAIHDTQLAASILWPNDSIRLKEIAGRMWGEHERQAELAMKSWLKKKKGKRYDYAPWDIMEPYARIDAELTWRLFLETSELIEQGEIDPAVWNTEMQLLRVLFQMEQRGVGFDTMAAWDAADQLLEMQKEVEAVIPFRPLTDRGASKYFFQARTPIKTTPTGQVAMDKDVVRQLVDEAAPGAEAWHLWNQIDTALSMWYQGWSNMVGPDERLRPVFHQMKSESDDGRVRGTITGRLAIERVQLMAIPHEYRLSWMPVHVRRVRSFFYAKRGCALYELDMSQAEMRVAAGVAQCKSLIEGFERGEDAHDATTRIVFGMDTDHPEWNTHRQLSKRLNFGMLYGAGIAKLAETIRLETGIEASEADVKEWRQMYKNAMPEIIRASNNAQNLAETQRWLPLKSGRIRHFRPDEFTHKAFNAVIQGNVAEMMKIIMVGVEKQWPGMLLLQIHDSIVLEVPDDRADVVLDIADYMASVFADAFGLPFKTDYKKWGDK